MSGNSDQRAGQPEKEFTPFAAPFRTGDLAGRFFFATAQAEQWYGTLKPYTDLEFRWVLENVPLTSQRIVDGGSHHGLYTVVFALGSDGTADILAVDPFPMNCTLTEINLRLNDATAEIEQCAISGSNGTANFLNQSNGRLIDSGGIEVQTRTLPSLMPDANIVKLDVEGAEYKIIPHAIDQMDQVHTWIVEVHPINNPHPDDIYDLFKDRGFNVLWVNRETNQVEPYVPGSEWTIHTTIFARR